MHREETKAIQNLREVLESILCQNSAKWQRYISAILKNETDAEDIVQEAVRRILDRNVPFYSAEQVRMYLGRAVSNAALELYNCRKRERRRRIPVMDPGVPPSCAPDPHNTLLEQERLTEKEQLLSHIQEGLAQMPRKQLEALRLTVMESQGASIRDIGMNHGIAYSTLRHRSKQGIRSLRRFLRKKYPA